MTRINKKLNPKMLVCIFGLIMALVVSLAFIKTTKLKEITKTYICDTFPIPKEDGSVLTISDSVALIEYKNYALYEFEEVCTFYDDTTLVKKIIENRYLLYKKKELYGYYYDSINAEKGKKIRVDSILRKRVRYGQSLYFPSIMELISSEKNKDGYELIEKYKCKTRVNYTYPDTTIIYYNNKLRHVSWTLSGILDSIKKMKVQKARAIFNSQYVKGYLNKFPIYEYRHELKEDTISNLDKYRRFIEEKSKQFND